MRARRSGPLVIGSADINAVARKLPGVFEQSQLLPACFSGVVQLDHAADVLAWIHRDTSKDGADPRDVLVASGGPAEVS